MADNLTPEQRRLAMQRVRSRDTSPELRLRRRAHALGLRYRLHHPGLPGRPDLAFRSRRLAVFVHGCFWHGHDCPRGARRPATNGGYWAGKIARNRDRDGRVAAALNELGWRVLVAWECELRTDARTDEWISSQILGPQALLSHALTD